MTIEELAKELKIKESTIKYNFKRTQETYAKKGCVIKKRGYGKTASYEIVDEWIQ